MKESLFCALTFPANLSRSKEHWKPLYETLLTKVIKFGEDVQISPKMSYVSLRRKTQFAILYPASKTRFEIQLKLKGKAEQGLLVSLPAGGMCTHKINLEAVKEVPSEVFCRLKEAYENAG